MHRTLRLSVLTLILTAMALSALSLPAYAAARSASSETAVTWRAATEAELESIIPARAPVIAERIETESRTASGIADGHGHLIAGVLLITAGYSANGKYSYFLIAQAPMKIGTTTLAPGNYLIGWTRSENELYVTLSEAATGKPVATATATRNPAIHRVESFHISPPGALSAIQLGRFSFAYSLP